MSALPLHPHRFGGGREPDPIAQVIRSHGAARVLLRAALALLRRPPRDAPAAALLDARLRRDMGLPPLAPPLLSASAPPTPFGPTHLR